MKLHTLVPISHRLTLALAVITAAVATTLTTSSASADTPVLPPLNIQVSTGNTTATGTLPFVQGTMYAVTYVITDTANAKLTNVSFSDQLPAGVTVAPGSDVNVLNCGDFKPANDSGASTISESGFTVYGNSPNHCAMEFFVVASTAEATTSDTPGTVDWTDDGTPEPSSDVVFPSWSVSVTTPPTLAITTPVSGANYAFNQKVALVLAATPGADDSIPLGDLYAVDDTTGAEVANGGLLPTDIPGVHKITVWAQTADGYDGSGQTVTYTVGSPQPINFVWHPYGAITYKIKYLATGRVDATLRYGSTVIATARKWVHVGYEMPMWVGFNAAGQHLIKSVKHPLHATLTLVYQTWNYHSFTNTPANVVENVTFN